MEEKYTVVENNVVELTMGEMKIGKAPGILITRGLGSCLGITIYDPFKKIGAMAHCMLPDIEKGRIQVHPMRFVNFSIRKMVEELEQLGVLRTQLVVKLFGGAHIFGFIAADSVLNVGQKNIDIAHATLKELGLRVVAEDTGGAFGRTIELNLENGRVLVKTASQGQKEV